MIHFNVEVYFCKSKKKENINIRIKKSKHVYDFSSFGQLVAEWCCFSVTKLCPALCNSMDCSRPRLPCLLLSPGVCSDSCPLSRWIQPTTSSSVVPFSSCLQSFPPSGSFPVSQFFTSGGQSIGPSTSVLPMNIQGWFPVGLTGLISLLSKGLSRMFSSTTVQKHQFFSAQPSLWSNSHICTWLLEKP